MTDICKDAEDSLRNVANSLAGRFEVAWQLYSNLKGMVVMYENSVKYKDESVLKAEKQIEILKKCIATNPTGIKHMKEEIKKLKSRLKEKGKRRRKDARFIERNAGSLRKAEKRYNEAKKEFLDFVEYMKGLGIENILEKCNKCKEELPILVKWSVSETVYTHFDCQPSDLKEGWQGVLIVENIKMFKHDGMDYRV